MRRPRPREGRALPKGLGTARPPLRLRLQVLCPSSRPSGLSKPSWCGCKHESRTRLHSEEGGSRSQPPGPMGWSLSHLTCDCGHSSARWSGPKPGRPVLYEENGSSSGQGSPSLGDLCYTPAHPPHPHPVLIPCPFPFPPLTFSRVSFSFLHLSGGFHDNVLAGLQQNEKIRVMWGFCLVKNKHIELN